MRIAQKLLSSKRLIFWDFDGVIKDSLLVKENALLAAFSDYGEELKNRIRLHHRMNGGISRFEKLPLYLSWAGLPNRPDTVKKLLGRMKTLVIDGVVESDWVPGVKEFLQANKYCQTNVVVSAAPLEELSLIMYRLNLSRYFVRVYGSPINKTDAIAEYMLTSEHPPKECLMIGDSKIDAEAAKANNVDFLLRRHHLNSHVLKICQGPYITDFHDL